MVEFQSEKKVQNRLTWISWYHRVALYYIYHIYNINIECYSVVVTDSLSLVYDIICLKSILFEFDINPLCIKYSYL